MGIGGYYDVIKVSSTISRGGAYTTDVECIFAQSGATSDTLEAICADTIERITGMNVSNKAASQHTSGNSGKSPHTSKFGC